MDDARPLVPYQTPTDERMESRRDLRQLMRCPPIDEDSARHVIECLAAGVRLGVVASMPGMPPYWVVNLWRSQNPEFDAACVRASEAGAEKMLWDTLEIADDTTRHPSCREVSIKARQHAMKVLHRKRFDPGARVAELVGDRLADGMTDDELAQIIAQAQRQAAVESQAPDSPREATPARAKGEPPLAGAPSEKGK